MAYTVPYSFEQFFENINLLGDHRATAGSRRDRLVSLLKKDFDVIGAFPTGSIPRFTAVRGYADLDVMVALHWGKHIKNRRPSEVLRAVQECLSEYRTGVRRNGQAVTLYYETWPNVDIVPVSQIIGSSGSVSHYEVPDMYREEWLPSDPTRHTQAMQAMNQSFGVEFKKIVKMVKWWNHQHSSLLESYHIEVIALKALYGSFSSYPWEIYTYFKTACDLAASLMWEYGGTVDNYLYLKPSLRAEVIKRLETARDKSHEAWYLTAGEDGNAKRAMEIWRQIFGDRFPQYG